MQRIPPPSFARTVTAISRGRSRPWNTYCYVAQRQRTFEWQYAADYASLALTASATALCRFLCSSELTTCCLPMPIGTPCSARQPCWVLSLGACASDAPTID